MNKLNFTSKNNGDILNASEWNSLVAKTDEIVTAINNGEVSGGGTPVVIEGDSHVTFDSANKHNLTIATTANDQYIKDGETKGGKINIEPISDLQIKSGDDIILCSHHREDPTEVSVKIHDGEDHPVKLQVNTADIVLTTKDKGLTKEKDENGGDTSALLYNDPAVLNVTVNSAKNTRGYLKLRAQAIDLRCEEHGGIAIQPKGYDGDGNMNKIKFEHGGGDGLEFGTFNTEKTSIFTDEYRFNKAGVWKMATRETTGSGKLTENEGEIPSGKTATGAYKYVKQADDFYDIITPEDAQTTTEAIIKSAAALNNDFIETSLSSKKNLKISASSNYKIVAYEDTPAETPPTFADVDKTAIYTKEQLKLFVSGSTKLSDLIDTKLPFQIDGEEEGTYFRLSGNITPKISLEAEEEVGLEAKYGDVVLTSGDTIKMEAPEIRLDAVKDDKTGGFVNFGATNDVIFINRKLTKSLNVEGSSTPTTIRQLVQNNTQDTAYWNGTSFIVPLKKVYADAEHTIEITNSNYNTYKEQPAYFSDGTMLPADYTCFIGVTTEDSGTYTTDIYKISTKGSSAVLSKNYKKVAQYTSQTSGLIGDKNTSAVVDEETSLIFQFLPPIVGDSIREVGPEEFLVVSTVKLEDIIEIVNELKTMKTNEQGPWARQASSSI